MPYFDEKFATVEHDPETDAIVASMNDFKEGEEFRRYMDSIIDAVEDTGADTIIADTSDIPPLAQEDQTWSIKDWSPRAQEAGVDHIGMVMPESVVAEMSVEAIVDMANDTIDRGLFDEMDEARAWAKEQ
jgi:hypothetical protein